MFSREAEAAQAAQLPRATRSIWHRAPAPLRIVVFYGCLGVLGALLLGGGALASLLSLLLPERLKRDMGRALIQACFRAFLGMVSALKLVRLDIDALDALDAEEALIIAPNHPSMLDALLIASRVRRTGCIMKAGLWDNPFLGAGARLAKYIRNDSINSMIRQASADLERGGKLLMFPEGTRTMQWPVNPLKGGVALIAQRARVPIQIVLIETDSPYLTKGWPIWKMPPLPLTYRATLGPRYPVSGSIETLAAMQGFFDAQLADSALLQALREAKALPPRTGGTTR